MAAHERRPHHRIAGLRRDPDPHPPRRLAPAPARRRCPADRGAAHRRPVRARHRHAQPQAA
eukprot:378-Eustigmatos_ZCMA.PRE.1